MTQQEFTDRVARHSGLENGPEVEGMVTAVLQALGQGLSADEAQVLADELPPRLGAALCDVDRQAPSGTGLYAVLERVRARTGAGAGVALEQLGVVASALTETVRADALARFLRCLPWQVGRLFTASDPPTPPKAVHHDPRRRTLADGGAGSRRPLFKSRPDVAQSESVAHAENPHAATKLSSSRGLTQEREGETLAAAGTNEQSEQRSIAAAKP